MAYYQKALRQGETVLYLGTLHWIIYIQGLTVSLIGAVVLLAAIYETFENIDAAQVLGVVAGVIFIIATLLLLARAIRRVTTEIVVTDRRVIYKTGLFGRKTVEMNASRIETVDVRQSILGRALGFGTIVVRGTGSTFEPLARVADPLALRNAILPG